MRTMNNQSFLSQKTRLVALGTFGLALVLQECHGFTSIHTLVLRKGPLFVSGDSFGLISDDDDDDIDDVTASLQPKDDDWAQAELTVLNAPTEPHPDLTPETVALTICRSLQFVDHPTPNAGLERCFAFFMFECRKAVTARQGALTVETFIQHGVLSPALQPFMGAEKVEIGLNDITYTPTQPPLRGALASIPVTIRGASILSFQYPSGRVRNGVAAEPPVTQMVLRLEQQRRPPNQGCWMVREILDVRYAFAGDMGNVHVGG